MAKRYYDAQDMRSVERESSGMISEDKSAIANLPQNVMMKQYPKVDYAMYDLDDTIKGIDVQMRDDMREKKRGKYPEKY